MGLSCTCSDGDFDAGQKVYTPFTDYTTLKTKRAKRCFSCNALIKVGDTCVRVDAYKVPETDVECKIYGYGGEVPLADQYLCEHCSDMMFNLEALGFCPQPWENQKELVDEYIRDYKPE